MSATGPRDPALWSEIHHASKIRAIRVPLKGKKIRAIRVLLRDPRSSETQDVRVNTQAVNILSMNHLRQHCECIYR